MKPYNPQVSSPDVPGLRVRPEPVERRVALQPLQVVGLGGLGRRLRRRRHGLRVVEPRQVGLRRRGRRGCREVVGELRRARDQLRQGELEGEKIKQG